MEYELSNAGVLVPKRRLAPIHVFVDETFLGDRTGIMHGAFVLPQDTYAEYFVPQCQEILKHFGAEEFKGSAIKRGNVQHFERFLDVVFTIVEKLASLDSPVHSAISMDGMGIYSSPQFDNLFSNVQGAATKMGIENHDRFCAEFARQMLWVHLHLPKIAPHGFKNEVAFTFDNKYRYAESSKHDIWVDHESLLCATTTNLKNTMTSMAKTLLSARQSVIRNSKVSKVCSYEVVKSDQEFGVQAADVLSHLFYTAIAKKMGVEQKHTQTKVDLLHNFVSELELDGLLPDLEGVSSNEKTTGFKLNHPTRRSRWQLV